MSTAVVRNKATGDVIPSMDTAFDEFVKVLEELENIPDPAEAAKMIGHLRPTKTRGQITAYQYKRVYGELRSLQIIRADPEYAGASLRSIDDTVLDDYFAARTGAQGVDSIWDIPNRGPLYVESKNWGAWARSGRSKEELLNNLDRQFIKHVQENFIRTLDDLPTGLGWPEGAKPRLQYVNSGDFFRSDESATGIFERFRQIVLNSNEAGFPKLREALGHGTSNFEANLADIIKVSDDPILISPFSN